MNEKGVKIIAAFIGITILCVFVGVVTRDCGFKKGFEYRAKEYYNLGKEIGIKQADFAPDIDYEKVVDTIVNINENAGPKNYSEFSKSVKNINEEILKYLAEVLELKEADKREILVQYKKCHEEITKDYFNQLLESRKGMIVSNEKSFITYNTYNSTDEFGRILSAHACNLAGLVVTLATTTPAIGKPIGLFLGKPCKFILAAVLRPIEDKLKKLALIRDYNISQKHLKSHIRSMIAELGTVKDNFETIFDKKYLKKLMLVLKSEADLRLQAKSIVKSGFRLDKYFSLEFEHPSNIIKITLPEPEVLSNEIEVKIINMENGWFVKIGKDKINEVNQEVRKWSFNTAVKSGLLEKAKENAEIILKTIFQPITAAHDQPYGLIIKFRTSEEEQIHTQKKDKN